jgi:hypothetical protein
MAKQLLLSVLIALVVIPLVVSRERAGARALRRTLFFALVFNMVYAFCALVVYPRLGVP